MYKELEGNHFHEGERKKTTARCTSETSVNFNQTSRCNNPADGHLHTHRSENLKSHRGEKNDQQLRAISTSRKPTRTKHISYDETEILQ
jgi:hypothetical protein